MPEILNNAVFVNVMRPSILSNEYSHNKNSAAKFFVESRAEAIEAYRKDFFIKVKKKGAFRDEVIRLYNLAQKQHVYLMCCCKPLQCHADIIRDFLIEMLEDKIFQDELVS